MHINYVGFSREASFLRCMNPANSSFTHENRQPLTIYFKAALTEVKQHISALFGRISAARRPLCVAQICWLLEHKQSLSDWATAEF